MTTYLQGFNASILALPAYWLLAVAPHAYALHLGMGGSVSKYDGRCPRSEDHKLGIRKRLGPERYAKFERAEAASANGFEGLPLFATAIIVGNMAGLKQHGLDGLDGFAASFLALRALYNVVYVHNTNQGLAAVRSAIWFVGIGLQLRVFYLAAKAMGSKGVI